MNSQNRFVLRLPGRGMASEGGGRVLAFAAGLLLLVASGTSVADDQPDVRPGDRLEFLLLRADDCGFALLASEVRPGRFKEPRDGKSKGGVLCELADAEGQILWRGRVDDPLRRRLEAADPEHPGRIIVKDVRLAACEFTLRVPHLEKAVELRIRRVEAEGGNAKDATPVPGSTRLPLPRAAEPKRIPS